METNEKLVSVIFSVGRLIKEKIQKNNSLADFTQIEIETLKFLCGKKETTMKDIADYLHIKPSSATPVINNLVKRGEVKRTQKNGDRRVIYIEITPKGLKSLQKKYKNIHKTINGIFGKLSENDKKALTKIFEKLTNI